MTGSGTATGRHCGRSGGSIESGVPAQRSAPACSRRTSWTGLAGFRDNRSEFGLLHSGWSAEHLGDKDKPHYWDDFWGVAGLYEAAQPRRAPRRAVSVISCGAPTMTCARPRPHRSDGCSTASATAGRWETFIPTGPADVNRLDSTIIGAVAYFHPCRLYQGRKLGDEIDTAARSTLDTIWAHFVDDGGFRHDAAWHASGALYLGLQLAHAFLLIGNQARMGGSACLRWGRRRGRPTRLVRRVTGPSRSRSSVVRGTRAACSTRWRTTLPTCLASGGTWGTSRTAGRGRGVSTAHARHLLLRIRRGGRRSARLPRSGVLPHWLAGGAELRVQDAPTAFGVPFGFVLAHDALARTVTFTLTQPLPAHIGYVHPLRLGQVRRVVVDGVERAVAADTDDVALPGGMRQAIISTIDRAAGVSGRALSS